MQWWRRRRLRVHLTLWHTAAMIAVLAVYAVGVLAFVGRRASQNLDSRLRGDYAWAAEMWDQRPDGTLTWFDAADGSDEDRPWLQVWDADGGLLFSTAVARRNPIPDARDLARDPDGRIVSVGATRPPYRVLTKRVTVAGRPIVIQVAKSEALMRADLTQLLAYLLFGLPLGVGVAGVGGYVLARRSLGSIERMTERARSITAARLSERLPIDDPDDELGRLATVFNDTLERLDGAFSQMRRFTGDVSHELRTPLAAIRTVGEVGLSERRSPDAYRGVIESMLEEADRLASLVERLLLLSRAEGGQMALAPERLDVPEIVDEVVAQLSVLAEDKRQRIVVRHVTRPAASSDRLMLRQALTNLVDNAIKYGPDGSEIRIDVSREADRVVLDVTDAGAGIPPERRAGMFDRFVRGAGGGAAGGWGLGVSIARWAVEANGGQLTYEPRAGGSTFRITLPAVA
jgi:heavy metal sensor kinase